MPEVVGRLRTPRLAAAPSSPVVGEVYYDTVLNKLLAWDGVEWGSNVDYNGSYVGATQYRDGDIVVSGTVAYMAVRPTSAAPTAWPSNPGIPTVVNGQWLKGSGGAAIWSPITYADITAWPAVADTAWHLVGAAGEPAFTNGWTNYGGWPPLGFRKDVMGTVFVKGLVASGTVGGAVPVFTLPVGYRPLGPQGNRYAIVSNNLFGASNVYSTGIVDVEVGSNVYAFLNYSFTTLT